jgi:putative toxin-antitoxin system antitoxin component (TIGR02293 family)
MSDTTTDFRILEIKSTNRILDLIDASLGLTNSQLANIIGVSESSLYRYKRADQAPSPRVQKKLSKLRELHQLLTSLFKNESAYAEWLYSSVPLFDQQRPIDLIRKGELNEVISVLYTLQEGAYL